MTIKLVTNQKIAETSSKGNQEKWFDEKSNRWYKLDLFGYEALAETVVSALLKKSNVEEKRLLEILERKQTIEEKINLLDQPYRNVLYLKYIRAYTIDEVALNMNYSSKRIYQLHKIALEKYLEVNRSNISSD